MILAVRDGKKIIICYILNMSQSNISHHIGLLLILGLATIAVVVLNVPFINSGLKNGAYSILAPVQKNIWIAGAQVYGFLGSFAHMKDSALENAKLKEEVNDLLAKNAQMEDLKKENVFLRQGLNLELSKDFDLKIADVIAKKVADDILIINKGSKDLVEVGMPVITSQKALVGKIIKVYDNFSEVSLITNKNFSFDVKIGDAMIDGLVKGKGGMIAAVDLVPKDKDMQIGAPVITSRLGGIFPAGLVIGTIKEVNKNDVGTFQSATLFLAFDVNGANQVFIANAKYPLSLGAGMSNIEKQ